MMRRCRRCRVPACRRRWRGGSPASPSPSSMVAQPGLAAAQQRHADEAAHAQAFAVVLQAHFGVVDLAVLRIEDGTAGPAVAILLHAPEEGHADDRLVLAGTFAFVADRVRLLVGPVESFCDTALQFAVYLGYLDDAARHVGLVVDGCP